MAGSVNKVILIGNLGRDPEVRSFQNGGKVCNLRIATSETWKDRNTGERREKTEWHSVAIFQEGLVRIAEQYLRKTVVGPRLGTPVAAVAALIWMTKSRSKKNRGGRVADLTTANTL